jgi:hypothetical protein
MASIFYTFDVRWTAMCCHSVGCGNDTPDNAIGYAMHNSRSHDAVIRVYDGAGNLIETHEHNGDFTEP